MIGARGGAGALALVVVACASAPPEPVPRPATHLNLLSSLASDPQITGLVQVRKRAGEIVLLGGPGYVRFPVELESFHLHVSARMEAGAQAAIVVRGATGVLSPEGVRVLLSLDDDAPTGSILDGPRTTAKAPAADTWFDVDLLAHGEKLVVLVDGQRAATARLAPGTGFVALEGRRPGSVVRFRSLALDAL